MAGSMALAVAPHQDRIDVQLLRTPRQGQSRRCEAASKGSVSCPVSHLRLILSRLGANTHLTDLLVTVIAGRNIYSIIMLRS